MALTTRARMHKSKVSENVFFFQNDLKFSMRFKYLQKYMRGIYIILETTHMQHIS